MMSTSRHCCYTTSWPADAEAIVLTQASYMYSTAVCQTWWVDLSPFPVREGPHRPMEPIPPVYKIVLE